MTKNARLPAFFSALVLLVSIVCVVLWLRFSPARESILRGDDAAIFIRSFIEAIKNEGDDWVRYFSPEMRSCILKNKKDYELMYKDMAVVNAYVKKEGGRMYLFFFLLPIKDSGPVRMEKVLVKVDEDGLMYISER